jgi:hypothetical protein
VWGAVALTAAIAVVAARLALEGERAGGRPEGPVVAVFPRGRITLAEVESEVRALPPALKWISPPHLLPLVAEMLATRRALVEEARAANLGTPDGTDASERKLVRALLEHEGLRAPRAPEEAAEHLRRFRALVSRALGGEVRVDTALLGTLGRFGEPLEAPRGSPPEAEPERFFLEDGDLVCEGEVHGKRGWYTGSCTIGESLGDALDPMSVLYLESSYGPVEGFLHRFAFDGRRRPVVLVGASTARTHEAMPGPIPEDLRCVSAVRAIEVTGTADREAARRGFERVEDAFRHCVAHHHWNNRYPEREGTLVVRIDVLEGAVVRGHVETIGLTSAPPVRGTTRVSGFHPDECLEPLRTYRLAGTGTVTYTVDVRMTAAP